MFFFNYRRRMNGVRDFIHDSLIYIYFVVLQHLKPLVRIFPHNFALFCLFWRIFFRLG